MDTIENLIIAIVKPLISQPDALTIKIQDTPEFMEYHLNLDQSDVGRVIGRKGRTISAIRTIVFSWDRVDNRSYRRNCATLTTDYTTHIALIKIQMIFQKFWRIFNLDS